MAEFNVLNLEVQIREMISVMTGLEKGEVMNDAHLFRELGVDSIKGVELSVAIQKKYGIRIDDSKIRELSTVNLIIQEVTRLLKIVK